MRKSLMEFPIHTGKGLSIWDHMMLTNPTFTEDDRWGDVACDSYHLPDKDLDMLRELGVKKCFRQK